MVAGSTPGEWPGRLSTSPYWSVTAPPVVETYSPSSSIKRTNSPCDLRIELRPGPGPEARRAPSPRRPERVAWLPPRRERTAPWRCRQLRLDLALDIDGGVHLVDQVDAERVLNILVAQDLVAGVHHLVRVQHRALNPVRSDRQDQQHRRDHDQRPHQHATTTLGLRSPRFSRRRAPGDARHGRRGSLGRGGVSLVGHYWRIGGRGVDMNEASRTGPAERNDAGKQADGVRTPERRRGWPRMWARQSGGGGWAAGGW